MTTWEYRVEQFNRTLTEREYNSAGSQGWELAAVIAIGPNDEPHVMEYVWKRARKVG